MTFSNFEELVLLLHGSLCLLPEGALPHGLEDVVGDHGPDGTQEAGGEHGYATVPTNELDINHKR